MVAEAEGESEGHERVGQQKGPVRAGAIQRQSRLLEV